MPRPDFTVSIPGPLARTIGSNPVQNFSVPGATFTSEVISGTNRRKPNGWLPPAGYSLLRKEIRLARGSCVLKNTSSTTSYEGIVGGSNGRFSSLTHFNGLLVDFDAETHLNGNAALIAARLKMKSKKVDLGVAYAERKATATMLGDTARRLAQTARQLRHGKFRDAARTLGIKGDPGKPKGSNWTNHWLQLQYGWKPLLSDVYGACDALSTRDKSDWRVTAKVTRKDQFQDSVVIPVQGTTSPTGGFDAGIVKVQRDRGVLCRIDALPGNDLTMSLASLGVTNPLLVAWELVPYSFVVDWAFPIGNWLDSLDALLGYSEMYTSTTYFNEARWSERGTSKVFPNGTYVKNSYYGSKRTLKVLREASSGVPFPSFPSFKDPGSLGHMANGLSLLAQAFGRR